MLAQELERCARMSVHPTDIVMLVDNSPFVLSRDFVGLVEHVDECFVLDVNACV